MSARSDSAGLLSHFRTASGFCIRFSIASAALPLLSVGLRAETPVLQDTFASGSTLNSATPSAPAAASTAYQLISSKGWNPTPSIASGALKFGIAGTTGGTIETQALFTKYPVTLASTGDYLRLEVTFTSTSGILALAQQLGFGLYDAGAVQPLAGGLNGTATSANSASAGAQNWQGYVARIGYSGSNNQIALRPKQSSTSTANNQDLVTTGSGSQSYTSNINLVSATSSITGTAGSQYTATFAITLTAASTYSLEWKLYSGTNTAGSALFAQSSSASSTNFITSKFDGLAIGWRATDSSAATTITLNSVKVFTTGQTTIVPFITTQPLSQTKSVGESVDFTVVADGGAGTSLAYQWTKGGAPIDGATSATYSISTLTLADTGDYAVTVTDAAGSATSATATLTVTSGAVAPQILSDPVSATILVGGSASFSVVANGTEPLSYQWQKSTDSGAHYSDIPDATGTSYSIAAATLDDAGLYRTVVTNNQGSIESAAATLVVNQAPAISAQPAGGSLAPGDGITLSVTATGMPAPTYQWKKNGTAIPDATGSTLTLSNVTGADTANYTVVVTNSVGSVASAAASVVVVSSSFTPTSGTPTPGATGINPDARLTVTFNQAVTPGVSGYLRIYDASNDAVVDTIDLVAATTLRDTLRAASSLSVQNLPVQNKTIGGVTNWNYYPITVSGNTATIYPRNGVLTYGKTYYVKVDAGVFVDASGLAFAGINDTTTWRFSTKASGPSVGATSLTVAADGSGDFDTVQGALDFVPAANTTPTVIRIKNGTYFEQVAFQSKHNLTLLGEDRTQTVIVYANNNTFNNVSGFYHRGVFIASSVHDVTIANLKVLNSTPQGGSQAEALIVSGSSATAAHNIITHCAVYSFQDTLQINKQCYVSDCYIEGDVDFMWGDGPVFLENCDIRMRLRSGTAGYFSQVRNPATNHGYVFSHCRFTADAGQTGTVLGRIDPNTGQFPASEVVLLNCVLGDAGNNGFLNTTVAASGSNFFGGWWLLNNVTSDVSATTAASIHNWDYNTTDYLGGTPTFNTTGTRPAFTVMPTDDTTIANYSNPSWVLGTTIAGVVNATWTPTVAPVISTQPVSLSVSNGSAAAFSVAVTAIPDATYQWRKDNVDIPDATSATLSLASVTAADAGSYTVYVSNSAGNVTSAAADLTVNVGPGIATQPASQTVTVGDSVTFNVVASGTAPFTYQWKKGTDDISGANASSYTISPVQLTDAGSYSVAVTNSAGTTTSSAATLTVDPALPVAPTAAAATSILATGFTANWSAVSGVTGYRLDVSTSNTFASFVSGYQDLDVGNNTSAAVTGLTASTTYYYRVRAVNVSGASPSSATITATTASAGVVSNISIVASGTTSGRTYSLTGSAYGQNFDSLASSGTFTWTNDSTLPGWYATPASGTLNATGAVADGTSNLVDQTLYSLGTSGTSERALAYHTRLASTYVGLGFVNNSGRILDSFTLAYTPEQWRENTESRAITFTVQYRIGATSADLNASTGWTTLTALAATTAGGSAGKTATLTASAVAVTVPDGSSIWFRWVTANSAASSTSSNDALALDNVAASFTAAPLDGAPIITTQPQSQTVNRDTDVTLSVVASSSTSLTYQWRKGGVDLPGETASSLLISAAQVADSGNYTVLVTNSVGSVLSNAATLTVNNVVVSPVITTQPQSQTVNPGDTVAFSVVATGTAPLTYQWKKNGTVILNAVADTLTLVNVAVDDAASYTVVVTNEGGSATSDPAVLTLSGIDTPPSIVTQSGSQSVVVGGTVSLSVTAAGTQPFTYQWYKDTVAVPGGTGSSLTLSNIASSDAGSYTVSVTNTVGTAVSDPMVITVTEPPTSSAGTLYVAPDGLAGNPGTFAAPTTLQNAISLVPAGGTIYLRGGTYTFSVEIDVARGNNGADGQLKRIFAYTPAGGSAEKPVLDFSTQPYGSTSSVSNPRGLWIGGDYWHIKGLEVLGAADNGIYVAGNHNIVERCITHANHDTGLQIGRYSSSAPHAEWPSYNLILNCESYDNYDSAPNGGENADGFACKLTSGPGNVFRGCISHHNIDDGWDLYTKSETGAIDPVTIDQCIAYNNGTLTNGTANPAGDKNGFKLGGEKIAVAHYVSRCIAFNNGKNGFTWNSNPGAIVLLNNLAFDNVEGNFKFDSGAATYYNNVSLWTTSTGPGSRTGTNDRYGGNSGIATGASNIFWYTGSSSRGPSINDAGLTAYKTAFVTLTVPTGGFARKTDGSIDLGDFARPVASSPLFNAGVLPATDVQSYFPFVTSGYYEGAPDIGAVETYLATPPTITSAPTSQSVLTGASVTFSVSVVGTEPFTYVWKKNGSAIDGATASTYTIASATVSDSGSYTVSITNSVSTTLSDPAVLTVAAPTAPTITTQPTSRTVNVGTSTTFTVAASGTSPFTYQWYKNDVLISGATASTYTIASAQPADAGSYTVVVTNSVNSTTSSAAVLTVDTAAIAPTITTQPASATVILGSSVTFNVVATGSAPFSYQWKQGGLDLSGANSATLTISNVQASDAGSYTVVVTNDGGSVESSAATLTVNAAPDTIYISDAFADGTRGTQSLPSSAAWWTSSGASNFTASTGAATQVVSSARTILAYFTGSAASPVTLAPNQKLTFEFVVQFTGFDSAAGAGVANLRVGLLRSPDDTKRFSADFGSGQPASGEFTNYTGYAAQAVANTAGDSAPLTFGVRDQAQLGLLNTPLAFTTVAGSDPAASSAMATGADYRVTFVVTRKTGGNELYFKIARVSDSAVVMENTVTDTATSFTAFDTAALYVGKASASSTYNIVLKRMDVSLGNLAIPSAPFITTQPASQSVGVGSNVTFTVAATGTSPFTYQWKKNGTAIDNATAATLSLTNVQAIDAADYSVTVTNSIGHADSTVATLSVTAATAPSITAAPQAQTVSVGGTATFTVTASGTQPFTYVWKHGTTTVGANSATLTITNAQTSDAGNYTVTVSNSAGDVTSSPVALTVNVVAPAITSQPASLSVATGSPATFTVVATGTAPLSYQWKKDGTVIPSATAATYSIASVQADDVGSYTVTVTNTAGHADSDAATLSLASGVPVTSFNLTGFATVGTGTTGGGVIAETDAAYRKVTTPQEFVQAIIDSNKTAGKVKVIEIMNDLALGWNEVGATVQGLTSNPLRSHATPKLHPTLIATGVSVLDIKAKSPLTIFSASGVTIKHVNFNLKGTSNIIIRNLKFDEMWEWDESSKGNYDSNDWDFITISNGGDVSNVWIDHCTFTKAYDGIVDLKAGTTNVTLSWCRYIGDDGATNPNSPVRVQLAALEANKSSYAFYKYLRDTAGYTVDEIFQVIQGHDKGHLMGSNSLKTENDTLTATFHHDWLQNVWDRAIPRLRGGNVHDYNIFVDDTDALAARRMRDAKAALLTTAQQNTLNNTYSFRPPLNGAISTEGGSVLVEKSIYKDCLWPLRNNQTDVTNAAYTGKIKGIDSIYSFLNTDNTRTIVRGDSTDSGNPMGPFQATIIPFAWDLTDGVLPYSYTPDDPAQLERILALGAGAGVLTWSKDNWLRTAYIVDTNVAPTISAHPQARSVAAGVDATFTVQASGSGTLTYQWKKGTTALTDGGRISGATTAVLTISAADASDVGSYSVTVSNSYGSTNSTAAALTVTVASAPTIATQPQSQSVLVGTDVSLSVVAAGSAPFTYQWQKDNTDLPGATGASLDLTAVQVADAGSYTVTVTNSAGSVTSSAAVLAVGNPPAVPTASDATSVTASGFTANWSAATDATGYRLDVATDSAFTSLVSGYADLDAGNNLSAAITSLAPATTYYYRVRAANAFGTSASSATITVATSAQAAAPVAAAATGVTTSGFTANWAASATATGYRLDVSTSSTFASFLTGYQDLDVGTNLSAALTSLTENTVYYYRVRAVNAVGTSASSGTVSVATAANPPSQSTTTILNETFPLPSATYNATTSVNTGLVNDANSLPAPTSTQAAWASFGTANTPYVQNSSINVSAGATRGLMAYFAPSTSAFSLSVGQTLRATVQFSFSGGTVSESTGNFRVGLLNSGGNGGATNISGASARFPAGVSNSLTTVSQSRGYSGYIADLRAANTASTDTLSLWRRVAATDSAGGSTQILGPTGTTDLSATSSFVQIGATGGGTVGAIDNAGTAYTLTIDLVYASATRMDITYRVTSAAGTVLSYSASQTTGTLVTSFDALMFWSTYAASPTITGVTITKLSPASSVAPTIATQPLTQSAVVGTTATFSVAPAGTAPFTYQWKKGSTSLTDSAGHISGATSSTLVLSDLLTTDAGDYSVVVTNSAGNVTSSAATLTILTPPTITTQPIDHSVVAGDAVTFSVTAIGTAPLSYQWFKNGSPIVDATASSYSIASAQSSHAGSYTVTVTNAIGSTTSTTAALTVTGTASAPTITTPPQSQAIPLFGSANLSVVATGTAPLTYQWYKDGNAIADATASTLSLANVEPAAAGSYTVTVTNGSGHADSAAAVITVTIPAPTITVQPQTQSALTGARVSLSVGATGYGTLSYQWLKNGSPISGATGLSLSLADLQASDATNYSVVVTNAGGSTTSSAAVLTLVTPAATLPTQPVIPAGVYKVTDYGAVADGVTNNATAIQAAITAASNAGGGTVELPAATAEYLSGPISLRSNINLQIDGGATLRMLPYGTYANANVHFITAPANSSNIAITGNGTIEGDGAAWWAADASSGGISRPRMFNFTRLTNVFVGGVTLRNSPQFHLAIATSTNVTIHGITISAPGTSPNTDGIDPSGFNFLIQGCNISVGDDNIAVKAGDLCGNFMIAGCAFGTGHGMSVGGQSNAGLDGMTVTNCTFNGTQFGIRLKADPTQGGPVQNLTYSNLTMTGVQYPILFYSYYNQIGSAGATSGSSQTTPTKVNTWNTTPPNSLASNTIPTWKNITVTNVTATGATGYSIIWGLPLADALIQNVVFNNVSLSGPGLGLYDATNIQFTGTNTLPAIQTGNALAITSQPQSVTVTSGGGVTFTVGTAGASGLNGTAPTFQWRRNGVALVNGTQPDGAVVSGATTATLSITAAHIASAGDYTCTVSNTLDGYDTINSTLVANSLPVTATSAAATLTVNGTETPVTITTPPASQTVGVGQSATFAVSISSTTPVTYQWLKDGNAIANATAATLTLSNVQAADAGDYSVLVTNAYGPVTSAAATLTVETAPVAPAATDATSITTSSFTANWSTSGGATDYRLDVATDSSFTNFVTGYSNLSVGASSTASVTNLLDHTTYYYRVRATNTYGTSASSNTIAVTTLNAHPQSLVTEVLHDQFTASAANAGLTNDANGFLAPTSTQAVWFGGGTVPAYTQGNSIKVSAGNRMLLAYIAPSTSALSLDIGESLTATFAFNYTSGTGASSLGDFRVALLNSDGNGTTLNSLGAAPRVIADNFSVTAGGDTPRAYSGYLADATAAATAPAADTLSLWRRDGSVVTGVSKSQQWAGPTGSDLSASSTFVQIGTSGGGALGAIVNNGTSYLGKLSVTRTSATETLITFAVTTGSTTVMSYALTETSSAPVTSFDTLALFSTYNAALSVTDLLVTKTLIRPTIVTPPASQSVPAAGTATFTVVASGSSPFTFQWKKDNVALVNDARISGATAATLTITGLTAADAGSYTVVVTNAVDAVTSAAATLTVTPSFAGYLAQNFTNDERADDSISGPSADPDADGLSNLLEYALGANPKTNDQMGLPVIGSDSGRLTLTYTRRNDVSDLTYTVEASSDLATWTSGAGVTEQLSATAIDATHDRIVVRDLTALSAVTRRFLRLRVALASPLATMMSPPLGAVNLTFTPGKRLTGMPLVNPAALRDSIASHTPTTLVLAHIADASALLSSTSSYYLEITGGSATSYVGERFEVDVAATKAAANNSLTIVPSASRNTLATLPAANALAGCTFVVRPHVTIGQLFGTKGNTPMFGSTVSASADQLQLLNPETQTFEVYYLLRNGTGTIEQWAKIGGGSSNYDGTLLPAGTGLVVARNGATEVNLAWLGEVRQNAFAQPLAAGNNLIAQPFPIHHSPVDRAMTYANGFTGSTNSSQADQLQVYSGGAFQVYYLLRNGTGTIEQWAKIGGGTTSYSQAELIAADAAVVVKKITADPLYFVPLPSILQP